MTHTPHITHRLLSILLSLGMLTIPAPAIAEDFATFVFSSNCRKVEGTGGPGFGGPLPEVEQLIKLREEDGVACHDFTVLDPSNLQTPLLKTGDTLTVVVTVQNSGKTPVSRVRAWIAYDPSILEGKTITIDPAFPTVTPGESAFVESEGYAKIGASAVSPKAGQEFVVATLTFLVKESTADKTVISFYDYGTDATKHTLIAASKNGTEEQLLNSAPGSLVVRVTPSENAIPSAPTSSVGTSQPVAPAPVKPAETPASSATAVSSQADLKPAAEAASSTAETAQRPSIFPDYQVENLRVTTQGTAAYLGWDILASGELAGYNVYYGATSGQYLHRKSIDKSETTLAIRGLPEGVTYYFAVRGVNAAGVETEFSREVSVTIGKPQTSTSPLSASMIETIGGKDPAKNDGEVKGETGMGSNLAIILGVCAFVGTLIAARRQAAVFADAPHVA